MGVNHVESYLLAWKTRPGTVGLFVELDIPGYVRALELYHRGDEPRVLVLRDEHPTIYRLVFQAVAMGQPAPLEALKYLGRTPHPYAVFLHPVERARDVDGDGRVKLGVRAPGR